jgi:hypothetical protein
MDFDSWLVKKGHTGFIPDAVARKLHDEWRKESGGFQPSIVNVPLPGSTNSVPAFMSSPNSATLMKDAAPKVTYKPDADGNLLAIEGTLANVVTNAQGKPIKVDPKSSRLEDLMTIMGPEAAAPAEAQPGLLARIFGGVPSSTPAPTPAPTPEATPMPSPTPGTAPLQGQTNAPAPVDLSTPEAIRAAWQSGRISDQDAVRLLRGQP